MSNDVYRPLFVMLEAIEFEAKRKLAVPPVHTRAGELSVRLADIEHIFRQNLDSSLSLCHDSRSDSVTLGYRCSLCKGRHHLSVQHRAFSLPRDWVEALLDAYHDREPPCNLELAPWSAKRDK